MSIRLDRQLNESFLRGFENPDRDEAGEAVDKPPPPRSLNCHSWLARSRLSGYRARSSQGDLNKWRKRLRFEDTEATSGRVVVREYELHSDLENYNP